MTPERLTELAAEIEDNRDYECADEFCMDNCHFVQRLITAIDSLIAAAQERDNLRATLAETCQHDDRVLVEVPHYECPDCGECVGRALGEVRQ